MRLPFNGSYSTTQIFNDGCCRASYVKFGMQGHNGIDYGLPCGTPVVAVFNGTIYSGFEANGYGNYIFLQDDAGNEAVYGHLSKIQIGSGRVIEGQQIGLSGATGNSTGCHLHFGYRPVRYNRNNGFLGYENPIFKGGNNMFEGRSAEDWANQAKDAERYKQGVVKSLSWKKIPGQIGGGIDENPDNIRPVIDSLEKFKADTLAGSEYVPVEEQLYRKGK